MSMKTGFERAFIRASEPRVTCPHCRNSMPKNEVCSLLGREHCRLWAILQSQVKAAGGDSTKRRKPR